MIYQQIGRRIRQKRRVLDITQEQLAEQIGLSVSFVGHIARGTRKPSVDTIIAICKALKISSDYVLGLDGEEGSKQ